MSKTLYDKLVDAHMVCGLPDGEILVYVDFHIMNEYTSPQAFSGLEAKGVRVHRPEAHLGVAAKDIILKVIRAVGAGASWR